MTGTRPLSVLLYGQDARTDAIADGLRRSPTPCALAIYAQLRNPGLIEPDRFLSGSLTDLTRMVAAAGELAPDLVVIGPEDPLSVGLADAVSEMGVPCFGPTQALARIETSKSWTRSLVDRYDLGGNPAHRAFHDSEGLADYVRELGEVVVKPDGLTGGKGVKIQGEQLATRDDALAYARAVLDADGVVVIEERLDGEEFSLQTITDGQSVVHCPIAQDHKRAYAGDIGPNTGGMGSYTGPDSSLPCLTHADVAEARRINEAAIEALRRETGHRYRGVLYGGFIAVSSGVRLIEYNARFGDPEAMNVLPLLTTDLVDVLWAAASGTLADVGANFAARATVCKYVVPERYPEGAAAPAPITVEASVLGPELRCYWGGAALGDDGKIRLTGSRGLAFVGIGDTVAEAEALAERGASSVGGAVRHRSDIGTSSLVARRVEHMRLLHSAQKRRGALGA